ncbi:MAG TPA: helix-turn-helix transcriptional regulator [Actinomycetota bacterium]|nr:helix-turn-helix transcriptional regulator [Actinomycetota bacterium]
MGIFGEQVGLALRRARRGRGLTLRAVSELSGGRYKPTSIAGYERGERAISLERFSDLCRLYDVDPSALLAEILEAVDGTPDRGVDVERLEALGSAEAALVAGFVREIRTLRHGRPSDEIVLRAGDVEVLATAAGRHPEELAEILGRPRRTERDTDPNRDAALDRNAPTRP